MLRADGGNWNVGRGDHSEEAKQVILFWPEVRPVPGELSGILNCKMLGLRIRQRLHDASFFSVLIERKGGSE